MPRRAQQVTEGSLTEGPSSFGSATKISTRRSCHIFGIVIRCHGLALTAAYR
jgi:hypothetical protein